MKFINFFKTTWGILIIIIVIISIIIYFNWQSIKGWFSTTTPEDTNSNSDGLPCIVNTPNQRVVNGIYKNGICVPIPATRLTAIQAQSIINTYSGKDSAGNPTINFNGTFDYPNLSSFPNTQLQNLLRNGWWISLLKPGSLNGYKPGLNGNYLIAIYDMKDTANPLNDGKTRIIIPAPLSPYINIT